VLDGAAVLALYQFDIPAARALFRESLALSRQHQDLRGVAWVLIHLGWLCHDIDRWRAARRFLQEGLAVCRRIDDRRGVARSLTILGMVAFNTLEFSSARSLYEQSLALNREVGDRWGTAWALHNFGRLHLAEAELGQADAHFAQAALEESVATWRELGERRHLAFAIADLAISLAWQGDLAQARAQLDEALSTFTELEDLGGKMSALFNCSRLFAIQGAHAAAARVYAADRALHAAAYPKGEDDASWYALLGERRLELARQAVGPELVAAAVAEGQAMSLDAAVAHARQQLGVSAG
jgi:tetratricopeptide (TPR) repeat protein